MEQHPDYEMSITLLSMTIVTSSPNTYLYIKYDLKWRAQLNCLKDTTKYEHVIRHLTHICAKDVTNENLQLINSHSKI